MRIIPLIKLQNFRKSRIHITHHPTPNSTQAFCHTGVENLLKGPDIYIYIYKINKI